jgi:acyl-CoA thioester hydrolase
MQDVAVLHSITCGGTRAMEQAGGTWVVRSHTIEYLKPAFAGDGLEVLTWVINFRRVRSTRRYRFFRRSDQTLIARGETEWVFVDAVSGRLKAIPAAVSDAFGLMSDNFEP